MHKPFSQQLQELIDEYGMFPGNPDAVSEEIIAALDAQIQKERKQYEQDKASRKGR